MDGIIIINKEKGCTSHDIVSKAKKIYNKKDSFSKAFKIANIQIAYTHYKYKQK